MNESSETTINISTPMTTATIHHLEPHTEYVFEVQAVNDNGLKGPSARLTASISIAEGRFVVYSKMIIIHSIYVQLLDFSFVIVSMVTIA